MSPALVHDLDLARADARADLERMHREIDASLMAQPIGASQRLASLSSALGAAVERGKQGAAGLDATDPAVVAWVAHRHDEIVRTSIGALELLRTTTAQALALRVRGLALFHWGEAVKWGSVRRPEDHARLHRIFAAVDRPDSLVPGIARGDGPNMTFEALYVRALLLARFAAGTLSLQQAEILDECLWRWNAELKARRPCPEGVALRVDLDRASGLCEGRRADGGPALYVGLDALERGRRETVKALQNGRMGPALEIASDAQISDYVFVLDHLRRGLSLPRGEPALRSERSPEARVALEVWTGLADILRFAGIAAHHDAEGVDLPARGTPSCQMRLMDESATGFGLEAWEADAGGLHVGDLIAWRGESGVLTLARVARRTASAAKGRVLVGVQRLSSSAVPLKLRRCEGFTGDSRERELLFVSGDDASGRHDGFLFPTWGFELQSEFEARIDRDAFRLRFNRVRAQGPGWILAGFEIVLRDATPPPEALNLVPLGTEREFVLVDDPYEQTSHTWDREIRMRLLN